MFATTSSAQVSRMLVSMRCVPTVTHKKREKENPKMLVDRTRFLKETKKLLKFQNMESMGRRCGH